MRVGARKLRLPKRSRRARRVVAIARVRDSAGNRRTVRKRLRVVPKRSATETVPPSELPASGPSTQAQQRAKTKKAKSARTNADQPQQAPATTSPLPPAPETEDPREPDPREPPAGIPPRLRTSPTPEIR